MAGAAVVAAVHIACAEMDIEFDIEHLTTAASVGLDVADNIVAGDLLTADMSHVVAAPDGSIVLEIEVDLVVDLEYIEFEDVDYRIHISC